MCHRSHRRINDFARSRREVRHCPENNDRETYRSCNEEVEGLGPSQITDVTHVSFAEATDSSFADICLNILNSGETSSAKYGKYPNIQSSAPPHDPRHCVDGGGGQRGVKNRLPPSAPPKGRRGGKGSFTPHLPPPLRGHSSQLGNKLALDRRERLEDQPLIKLRSRAKTRPRPTERVRSVMSYVPIDRTETVNQTEQRFVGSHIVLS